MLLSFFALFLLKFNICYANSKQKVSVYENNVADNFMNASSYKNLVGINKNNGNFEIFMTPSAKRIEIKKSFSCGDHSFPHGIFIDRKTNSPKMYCEPHKCFKPKYIECFKNVPVDECKFDNEWISGFIQRKNETHHWLEVECCHYKENIEGKFVKTINITVNDDYIHGIVVKKGNLSEYDFPNNIQKRKMDNGSIFYFVDVYRMKCPGEYEFARILLNQTNDLPYSRRLKISSDGEISVMEESTDQECSPDSPYRIPFSELQGGRFYKMRETCVKPVKIQKWDSCGKGLFPHALFMDRFSYFPKMLCEPHSCLKPEKVTCVQKSPISSCSESNEWVAGFITVNATVKVECCHYQDPLETTFVKTKEIHIRAPFFHEIFVLVNNKSRRHFEMTYVNNIQRIRRPFHRRTFGTAFEASVYQMRCPIAEKEVIVKKEKCGCCYHGLEMRPADRGWSSFLWPATVQADNT